MEKRHLENMKTVSIFIVVFFLLLSAGVPSPVSAALSSFVPKIYDYSAELEIDATYYTDENKSNGRGFKTTDFFSRERLNFYLTGYVYHSRFIQYSLKLSEGLKQRNYTNNTVTSGWIPGIASGYDFTMIILPEHPYNLQLFARRYEPLSKQTLASQAPSVNYSKGAIFTYKKKPYFVTLSYVNNITEATQSTYTNTSYSANATYYKQYSDNRLLALSGSYNHRDFSSSLSSADNSSDDIYLNNNISWKKVF